MKNRLLLLVGILVAICANARTTDTKSESDIIWTIAGAVELTGADWDPLATENNMSTSDNIVYTLVKQGCKLEEGIRYGYKVVKNHSWDENYGSDDGDNARLWVDQTGEYTITFTFNSVDHNLYAEATRTGDYVPDEKIWTVVGVSDLLGKEWDLTATENDMVYKGDGLYVLHKYSVTLLAETEYEYKVAANRSWTINYGSDGIIDGPNAVLVVDVDGVYDVLFTFSVDTKQLSAEVEKSSEKWTVAGVKELMGIEWDPTATENDMVLDTNGLYVLTKKDVTLLSHTSYEYKVVRNHSWDVNYGSDGVLYGENATLSVDSNGVYDVKFTFSVDTKQLSAETTYKSEYTPVIPDLANVNAYYYVGALNQWSSSDKSYPFSLLDDGKTWELTITSFENNGWFKIAPDFAYENQTTFWSNLLCALYDGCEELSGFMFYGNRGAWHLPQSDSIYSYTIRMIPSEMTYSIEITPVEIQNESDVIKVLDSNGNDVTSETEVIWYDINKNEIAKGSVIGGLTEGTEVYYSVLLNQNLGMRYREVLFQKTMIDRSTRTISLQPIEEVVLHGKVVAYGVPLPRVDVSLTQWLNGKYEYETSTLTDANGEFSLNGYNDSTVLIVTANGYVDYKKVRRNLNYGGELGEIDMIEVQGKVIALNLIYQEATREGAEPIVQNWYSDTRNIEYTVQNVTQGKDIDDFAIQQGNIVMPTGTDRGDKIQITVRSLNEKFAEATAEGLIADNDTANVSINLLAFGGIEATYGQKGDDNLLAMLYDSAGKLQMRTVCSTSRLTFTNLEAGNYTLVTMGYNGAIGSVSDISDLANMDLAEGTDYVRSTATVRDGYITSVNVASVPELDASKFEYTGTNTSYMPNKIQLVTGNFITLTARLDFKEQYADKIDHAQIVIDIPEGCTFVSGSVVIGSKPIPHSLNGNKLTITVSKDDLDQRIRFCVIPNETGSFMTTAIAEFDYKGAKTQPIGQVKFEATLGELYVPSTTKRPTITLGGIGVPRAEVEVYDNESLIGTTTSLGNGKWSLSCELNNAYNLSTHEIYVKYRVNGNVVGLTEAKDCFYDINAVVPKTVTMVNTAHPAGDITPKVYETVFNYETVMAVQNYYRYWPDYPDFTFLIDLSENDTTKVSDVTLYIHTTDGDSRKLSAEYDGKLNRFVATSSFDMYSLPVNVSVDFDAKTEIVVDNDEFKDTQSVLDNCISEYNTSKQLVEEIFSEDLNPNEIEQLLLNNNLMAETVNGSYTLAQINEMSDEELDYLISEYDNLADYLQLQNISDTIDALFSYEKYVNYDLGGGRGIEIRKCDGLTEDLLIEKGFEKLSSKDGDYFYMLSSDSGSEMVCFSQDLYIIVRGDNSLFQMSRRVFSSDGIDKFNDIIQEINKWFDKVRSTFNEFEKTFRLQVDEKIVRKLNASLAETNKTLSQATTRLNMKNVKLQRLEKELAGMNSLTLEYALKKDELTKYSKEVKEAQKLFNAAKKSQVLISNALKAVKPLYNFLTKANPAVKYASVVNDALKIIKDYQRLYSSIPKECPNSNVDADMIRRMCISRATVSGTTLISKVGAEAAMDISIGTEILGTAVTGGASAVLAAATIAGKFLIGLAFDFAYEASDKWSRKGIEDEISNCKKKNDDDDGNDDDKNKKKKRKGTEDEIPDNDPSGYVYEAVPTNRIEGVKATVYYSEHEDGAYPIQWDATEFGQINPQITDESGLYAWDVPQGFWKVIFEKDGYESTQTDWLPVPPPQLEVNIPMSQAIPPYVESAMGVESGITLGFSKYMKPNTLTKSKRVTVTVNGKNAGGDVELLNTEENPFNKEKYASKIKFVPNTSFKTSDEVIITVKKEVESYAGKEMTEDFVQRVMIESEITEIACDSVMAVDYQGTCVLEVSVLPATAAKGKTVLVSSTSTMIASTDAQSVTLNDEGKARIVVSGELPGNASLHLSMPEAGKEKYVVVNVVTKEDEVVKTPKASKLSGSEFDNSYMLSLTCATKGATIYYTIDGSCPCDEQTRKKYTGPINLPEGQVTLQAIAVREGMADSEIATFNYIVTKDASGIKVIEESRDFEASYQNGSIVITGAKGANCHIYDLQGRELAVRSHIGNQARINVPKSDVYVVSIMFANEQTVVHKIMAK